MFVADYSAVLRRLRELRCSGVTDIGTYLDRHPTEITAHLERIKVLHANQPALAFFDVASPEACSDEFRPLSESGRGWYGAA